MHRHVNVHVFSAVLPSGSLIASIWLSDSQQPFVDDPEMRPDVLYMKEKQPLVIPCRVTHPNVTSTLVKVSGKSQEVTLDKTSKVCRFAWGGHFGGGFGPFRDELLDIYIFLASMDKCFFSFFLFLFLNKPFPIVFFFGFVLKLAGDRTLGPECPVGPRPASLPTASLQVAIPAANFFGHDA